MRGLRSAILYSVRGDTMHTVYAVCFKVLNGAGAVPISWTETEAEAAEQTRKYCKQLNQPPERFCVVTMRSKRPAAWGVPVRWVDLQGTHYRRKR